MQDFELKQFVYVLLNHMLTSDQVVEGAVNSQDLIKLTIASL